MWGPMLHPLGRTTLKLARYTSVVFVENLMHVISHSYQLFNCVSKQFCKIKSTMGLLWWDIWRRTCTSVGIFWHASDFCNFPNLQIKHQICNKNLNLYVQMNSIKSRKYWPSWFSMQRPKPWLQCPFQPRKRTQYYPPV